MLAVLMGTHIQLGETSKLVTLPEYAIWCLLVNHLNFTTKALDNLDRWGRDYLSGHYYSDSENYFGNETPD